MSRSRDVSNFTALERLTVRRSPAMSGTSVSTKHPREVLNRGVEAGSRLVKCFVKSLSTTSSLMPCVCVSLKIKILVTYERTEEFLLGGPAMCAVVVIQQSCKHANHVISTPLFKTFPMG